MKKIKVLYILPEIDGGGVGAVTYNYIKNISLNEFQIDLIVFDSGHKQLWHNELIDRGINIYYVTSRPDNLRRHFKEVNSIIRNGKYDIVHAHMSEWASVYCYIAWRNKVKVRIGHSHIAGSLYSTKKRILLKLINIILRKSCNGYFACGEKAAEYLWGTKKVNDGQVYVMNNAISSDNFKYDSEKRRELKEKFNINEKIVLGHVGRFNEQKNHKYLIRLFKEINLVNKDIVLVLIGDGELKKQIHEQIKELKLENNVIVLGKRKDVNEWLNVFDLLLLPSLYEGLPVIGIEAQMNGLPILASKGVTEEIEILDTTIRLSLDEDIQLWRDESIKLAMNNTNRIEACRIMKKKGYDITEEAYKLECTYKKLLNS